LNVVSDSIHEAIRNEHEVGAFSGAQRVFQSFHERPLLIVFEQQVAQWASLGLARSHDFGKQNSFFFVVVVFVGKRPEKAQKRPGIFLIDSFTVFPFHEGLKDIKRAKNDVVVLPQKVCAFHTDAPFGCRTGSEVVTCSVKDVFVESSAFIWPEARVEITALETTAIRAINVATTFREMRRPIRDICPPTQKS
jgi:hypothetical protein